MMRARARDRSVVAPAERPVDLAVMISPIDPAELTLRLMSIESTSGQEGDVIAWLDGYLVERGWRTWRIPVTPGRDDLFATVVENPARHAFHAPRHRSAVHSAAHERRRHSRPRFLRRQGNRRRDDLRGRAVARRKRPRGAAIRRRRGSHARRRARGERRDRGEADSVVESRDHQRRADREHARAGNKGRDSRHGHDERTGRALRLPTPRPLGDA